MAETRSSISSSKSRFWLSLLAFFVGLAVLDLVFAAVIESNAPISYTQVVGSKAGFLDRLDYDIWVMGDSLAADGIVPSVIERETGMKAFNWGVNAASPFETEILLKDLERRAKFPKYVVVTCSPQMFIKPANDGPIVPAVVRSPDLQIRLIQGSVERGDLSAVLSSGRKKLLLKAALIQALKRRPGPTTGLDVDSGFIKGRPGSPSSPRPTHDTLRFDQKTADFQARAFEALIAQCDLLGARVALVLVPVYFPRLSQYFEDKETSRHYLSTVSSIARKYKCDVFDGQTKEYCSSFVNPDFADTAHLSNEGADKFTADLARWLRVKWD